VEYGNGCIDNFLIEHPEAYKVGVFYPVQRVENIPVKEHDFRLDEIFVRE